MPGLREDLQELLESVRRGELEPQRALERLAQLPFRDLGFARVDLHRELRQGAPEAVLAEGKTPEQVGAIVRALLDGGAGSVLVTRAGPEARRAVLEVAEDAQEHELARLGWEPPEPAVQPNFFIVTTEARESGRIARSVPAVLTNVFGVRDDEVLLAKMLESLQRGPTPRTNQTLEG